MTGQQLKNSILQMAVQGKLVPQDPNDEPASVLLERIRAEKEKLIKEGKIKKEKNPSVIFRGADNLPYEKIGKNEPVCIADEVPFEIPESWEWVRVKTFTALYNGRAFKPSDWTDTGLPIVRIQNLNNPSAPYNLYKGSVESEYQLHGGELLFAWSGTPGTSFGAHIWHGKDAVLNQHIFRLEFPEELIYKPYYMHALNQRIGELIKAAHGSAGLQHVTKGVFENTLIPIPPYKEQIQIVNQLNHLAPSILDYVKAYGNIENLNNEFPEKLKKSILQYAIQGKLVPQDPTDEPASALLERIHAGKEQLIKSGKIKRDKHESIIFRRDNSYYERVDGIERCIDDEMPFEIPESWRWTRWGTVATSIQYGYNAPAKQCGRIRMVRISDIHENLVTWTTVPFCDIDELDISTYLLQPNDILFARTGGTVGKSFLVRDVPYEAIYAGYLIRTRYSALLCPQYLKYFMESPLYWQQLKTGTTATAQPNCNGQTLSNMLLPLPPAKEQYRIVEKINRAFAKVK